MLSFSICFLWCLSFIHVGRIPPVWHFLFMLKSCWKAVWLVGLIEQWVWLYMPRSQLTFILWTWMALKSLPWGDSVCLLPRVCESIFQNSETEWEEGAGEFSVHYADFISDSDFGPPQLCSSLWLVPRPEPCGPAVQIFLISLGVSQFLLKGVGTTGSTHLPVFSLLLWVPTPPHHSALLSRGSPAF